MPLAHPIFPIGAAWNVIQAQPHWRAIDFISDLHLQVSQTPTFDAWRTYMATTPADALFILGDLFEVWVGDDMLTDASSPHPFESQCQAVLTQAAQRIPIFLITGNRDFLLGSVFAATCAVSLLSDPAVLNFDGQRWLLSHGDALCLGDSDYQAFRTLVRGPAWQADFLAKPLAERQTIARGLRSQSEARKAGAASYADVDPVYARHWLQATRCTTLIHGHTHRPANHTLHAPPGTDQKPLRRWVLSDWDASATPPRLEVLRLRAGQLPERMAPMA